MKILFLGGPSGSGKSHFASQYLAKKGWLHVEIDRHDQGDGIDLENLRSEWDAFWLRCEFSPLHQELLRRAANFPYIVLSFASTVVFNVNHLRVAAGHFCAAYLYGHPTFCLQAFLDRESSMPRDLGLRHWDKHNRTIFGELSLSHNQPLLVEAFCEQGARRDAEEIFADIMVQLDKPN